MKWLAVGLIALGAVAASLLPAPTAPEPERRPDPEVPSVAVCPIEEGGGRNSQLGIISSQSGPVDLAIFGGGGEAPTLETSTGPSGAVTVQAGDLQAVGRIGALVETSMPTSAGGVTVLGTETIAGEPCLHGAPGVQAFVSGGATTELNEFELQLMNPYAGEAVVDLIVQSESGRETDDRFDSVVVPARGSIIFDLTRIIPGRNSVSVTIEPVSGSAWVTASQRSAGASAWWRGVEAASDWFLPVPSGPGSRVNLATPVNAEVNYQIDLYGPEGLVEAWRSGTLPARGSEVVDLAELGGTPAALRVVATGQLVPSLWQGTPDTGLAVTTASPVQANSWLLPGAAAPVGGSGSLVMVNSGVDPVTATVRTIRGVASEQQVPLPVDAVVEIPLASADAYRVDSDGPVVVMWVARRGTASMAAMGVPLSDE